MATGPRVEILAANWSRILAAAIVVAGWGACLPHAVPAQDVSPAIEGNVDAPPAGSPAPAPAAVPANEIAAPEKAAAPAAVEPAPAPAAAPVAYMQRPYRVLVEVSAVSDPLLPAATVDEWIREAEVLLRARFRECWQLTIAPAPGERRLSSQPLQRLADDEATARWLPAGWDKVWMLSVEIDRGQLKMSVREWDETTRTLTATAGCDVIDRRDAAARLAGLVSSSFRPAAQLETLTESLIEMQIRGGELLPAGGEHALFSPGDLLVACLRYQDRDQTVRRIQHIPWTFLRVETVDRARMTLSLTSTFSNPLPAATRRVEVAAVRIRPQLPETRLTLTPRNNAQKPLAGFRCEVYDSPPVRGEPPPERIELTTDRQGEISVPADPEHPLRHLYVYSGTALLAKVPLVPGLQPALRLEVPDDSARLNVEGEIELLQGQLIDIVASREVLMARTRAAANNAKWPEFDSLLAQLGRLPTLDQYNARIETLQLQAVYEAQRNRDRVAEARIKRLCQKMRESAEKHLNPYRLSEFRREMQSLRK